MLERETSVIDEHVAQDTILCLTGDLSILCTLSPLPQHSGLTPFCVLSLPSQGFRRWRGEGRPAGLLSTVAGVPSISKPRCRTTTCHTDKHASFCLCRMVIFTCLYDLRILR